MGLFDQLKIVCGYEIVTSESTPSEKKRLLSFVEQANEEQLKYFVIFHKLPTKQLTENERINLDSEFKKQYSSLLEDINSPVGVICGMSVFSPNIWASWRQLKTLLINRNLKCKGIQNIRQKNLCMDYSKIIFFKKQLYLIRQVMRMDCPKTQNPNNCIKKGQTAIQATNNKLQRLLDRSSRKQDQGLYNF